MAPGLGQPTKVELEVLARGEQREAFGESLHHSVFDAVVDHLGEVPRAARPAMQPAGVGRRRQQAREGLEALDGFRCASQHQAIAVGEAVDAAGHAGIYVAQAALRHFERARHRILVEGVAAVDQRIAGRKQRQQLPQRVFGGRARGQHGEEHAFARQLRGKRRQALDAVDLALPGEPLARRRLPVVRDDVGSPARHAARHVGSHPAQSDDSDFHACLPLFDPRPIL